MGVIIITMSRDIIVVIGTALVGWVVEFKKMVSEETSPPFYCYFYGMLLKGSFVNVVCYNYVSVKA